MRDASSYPVVAPCPEAERCPRLLWHAAAPFPHGAPTVGDPIEAYANEGRWIVMCPDCNGAQLASQSDPRFMCIDCGNIANGGAWRPTTWPAERPGIDTVLDARALLNQNWIPGETIDDLLAEDAAAAALVAADETVS